LAPGPHVRIEEFAVHDRVPPLRGIWYWARAARGKSNARAVSIAAYLAKGRAAVIVEGKSRAGGGGWIFMRFLSVLRLPIERNAERVSEWEACPT
jgi:hypothetical protein